MSREGSLKEYVGEGRINGTRHVYVMSARTILRARENVMTAMQLLCQRRGIENPRIEIIDVRLSKDEA